MGPAMLQNQCLAYLRSAGTWNHVIWAGARLCQLGKLVSILPVLSRLLPQALDVSLENAVTLLLRHLIQDLIKDADDSQSKNLQTQGTKDDNSKGATRARSAMLHRSQQSS